VVNFDAYQPFRVRPIAPRKHRDGRIRPINAITEISIQTAQIRLLKQQTMRTGISTLCLCVLLAAPHLASARGLRIPLPKHSEPTPVQKLNQDGVKELKKHNLEKAERLFYRAYLVDPDDPFTLNNLGYVSELRGKVDRALRYYELAAKENNSETVIAEASARNLEGRKLSEVTSAYGGLELRVNHGNLQAMSLLAQGRNQEAEDILRQTLKLAPRNAFTLNNLGFALEGQGDLESAMLYYSQASFTHSSDPVVVAIDPHWRGKAISEIAANNATAVRTRLTSEQSAQDKAARLNAEGVSALNHNQQEKGLGYFEQAYKLDPYSAFSLNNMGYLAEARKDQETANEFYSRARSGNDAGAPVSMASHHEMVGSAVGSVADSNVQATDANLQAEAEAKRRSHEPIVLRRRDNTRVTAPTPDKPSANPTVPRPPVPRPPVDNAPVENTVPRPPQ
jgi:tetratricopeptide (TPR) repeat protein